MRPPDNIVYMFFLTLTITVCIFIGDAVWGAPTVEEPKPPTVAQCQNHADMIVYPLAVVRDMGMLPPSAYNRLLAVGFPPEVANNIIQYVYGKYKRETPMEIKEIFMRECAGERV